MSNPQTATERFGLDGGKITFDLPIQISWTSEKQGAVAETMVMLLKERLDRIEYRARLDAVLKDSLLDVENYIANLIPADHLAAHPGDVEGYLGQIIGGKEKE